MYRVRTIQSTSSLRPLHSSRALQKEPGSKATASSSELAFGTTQVLPQMSSEVFTWLCQLSVGEFRVIFGCSPKHHSSLKNACCSIKKKKSQGLFYVYLFKTLPLALFYFTCAILDFLAQENEVVSARELLVRRVIIFC